MCPPKVGRLDARISAGTVVAGKKRKLSGTSSSGNTGEEPGKAKKLPVNQQTLVSQQKKPVMITGNNISSVELNLLIKNALDKFKKDNQSNYSELNSSRFNFDELNDFFSKIERVIYIYEEIEECFPNLEEEIFAFIELFLLINFLDINDKTIEPLQNQYNLIFENENENENENNKKDNTLAIKNFIVMANEIFKKIDIKTTSTNLEKEIKENILLYLYKIKDKLSKNKKLNHDFMLLKAKIALTIVNIHSTIYDGSLKDFNYLFSLFMEVMEFSKKKINNDNEALDSEGLKINTLIKDFENFIYNTALTALNNDFDPAKKTTQSKNKFDNINCNRDDFDTILKKYDRFLVIIHPYIDINIFTNHVQLLREFKEAMTKIFSLIQDNNYDSCLSYACMVFLIKMNIEFSCAQLDSNKSSFYKSQKTYILSSKLSEKILSVLNSCKTLEEFHIQFHNDFNEVNAFINKMNT